MSGHSKWLGEEIVTLVYQICALSRALIDKIRGFDINGLVQNYCNSLTNVKELQ